MTLKERIEKTIAKVANYYDRSRSDNYYGVEDECEIDQATTDILKVVELDEGKILGIIKDVQIPAKPDDDETYLHLEWIEAVAKAIAKGDIYKEEG